ncbi:hypothetical protein PG995_004632 [Apiospora arundinis]
MSWLQDELDLVFRGETKPTKRRAHKANKKALAKVGKLDGESPEGSFVWDPVVAKEVVKSLMGQTIIPSLNVPVETQASCYFLSNFVLIPRQGSTRGFMDFLVPMIKSEVSESHLQHAFNACSIALINNCSASRNRFTEKALEEYTQALMRTNAALRDPDQQKTDSTLAAVLLLGLFENIAAKQIGMLAWGSHIEGAIHLVKQRGRKQLKTQNGLMLFIAVRTQMIIYTLTTGKAPIMGVEWWLTDAIKEKSAGECQRIMIKTGELRAEITRLMNSMIRSPENVEVMLNMIRRCQTVDQEVVNWTRNVPEHWHWKTVAWEDNVPNGDYSKADVYPGRVDVYRDFYIASVWNMTRTARLILASLIVRSAAWVCAPIDFRTTPEYATASRTWMDTITEIIASVPYHLGWHLNKPHIAANLGQFACGEEDAIKSLAGYFLTWPLSCVMGQDYTTDNQRAWVVGRLRYIGNDLGVKYAHILADLQIRVPSMMIRRDGLMASPYGAAHNFEKLTLARTTAPTPGYTMNPLQQRETMHKKQFEQRRTELLTMAAGPTTSHETQWVAQNWLTLSERNKPIPSASPC